MRKVLAALPTLAALVVAGCQGTSPYPSTEHHVRFAYCDHRPHGRLVLVERSRMTEFHKCWSTPDRPQPKEAVR